MSNYSVWEVFLMNEKRRINVYISKANSDVLIRVKRYCKIDKGDIVDKALTRYFDSLGDDAKITRALTREFVLEE